MHACQGTLPHLDRVLRATWPWLHRDLGCCCRGRRPCPYVARFRNLLCRRLHRLEGYRLGVGERGGRLATTSATRLMRLIALAEAFPSMAQRKPASRYFALSPEGAVVQNPDAERHNGVPRPVTFTSMRASAIDAMRRYKPSGAAD